MTIQPVRAIPTRIRKNDAETSLSSQRSNDVSPNVAPVDFGGSASVNAKTVLTPLVDSFESVLKHDEIDAKKLLEACETFYLFQQEMGSPRAAQRDFANNMSNAKKLYSKTLDVLKEEQNLGVRNDSRLQVTLDDMLTAERNLGIHKGCHLQENSGAVGLQKELQPHHGWLLRQIYTTFLKTMMPTSHVDFLAGFVEGHYSKNKSGFCSDYYQEQAIDGLKRLVHVWEPVIKRWEETFVQNNMEDPRRA